MARKITLQKILAYDATDDARKLIREYGLSAKNHQDLENKLGVLIREKNVDALKKMAEIHPDKIIFEMLETKSNACGCSGEAEVKSNCSGGCSCGGSAKAEQKSNACGCSSKTSGFNGSGDGLDLGANYGGRDYRYNTDNTNTYVILAVAMAAIFIAVKKHT
jgi:hypothetical protein